MVSKFLQVKGRSGRRLLKTEEVLLREVVDLPGDGSEFCLRDC